MIECPGCRVPVLEVSEAGRSNGVCPSCNYALEAITGKLSKRYSKQLTIHRKTKSHDGVYKREYEFRIDTPDGRQEMFEFQIDGKEDRIKARRGDRVSVVYTLRGEALEEIVSVIDHTTNHSWYLASPSGKAKGLAGCRALIIGGGITLLLLFLNPWSPLVSIGLGLGSMIAFYVAIERSIAPRVQLDQGEIARLKQATDLRQKKQELHDERADREQSVADLKGLRKRLEALITKMESVGDDVYGSRIETSKSGIRQIETLMTADSDLVKEMDRTITMVEIDLESLSTMSDVVGVISGLEERLVRIHSAREHNDELMLALRANEEVARLLS